jgi:uncharacterized membrane protein YhaH (DUF805 family)
MHWMLMPLRRYADFSGRSRRREYWMFFLLNLLISLAVWTLLAVTFIAGMSETEMTVIMTPVFILYALIVLAFIIPGIAVTVRRLHDTDRSGWSLLLGLIPLVGAILLIIYYCTEGTAGPNRFGPDPKANERLGAPNFA